MNSRSSITALIAILVLANLSFAYDASSVTALLRSYNISGSTIASLKAYNTTYNGMQYVLLYKSGQPQFLVNATGTYSFVLNSSRVAAIITGYITANSLQSINASKLNAQMHKYENSSSGPLTRCLYEVGIPESGQTCTLANYCASCNFVPICKKALTQTGGASGPMGTGVIQLEAESSNLTAAFSTFYSATSTINASNANQQIVSIKGSFSTVSSVSTTMSQNPLFPPPATADYSQCQGFGSSTSNTVTAGPWYCNSVGFCEFLTYNSTLLTLMQTEISSISSLPLTTAQINKIAVNISNNENTYVAPLLNAQKQAQLNALLNTTLANYSIVVSGSASLLTHVSNSMISSALAALTANYNSTVDNYIDVNLTAANKTLGTQMRNLTRLYKSANSTYSGIAGLADNNTALLIEAQIANPNNQDPKVSSLSFQQAQLNLQVNGKISNLTYTKAALLSINANAKSILSTSFGNPLVGFTRAVDMPAVMAIEGPSQASYASKLSSVPLYATLVSLAIGIVVLALLAVLYVSLNRSRRIRIDSRSSRNWTMLFAFVLVIVLIYVFATHALASSANSSAPLSSFKSSVASSNSVLIAVNGTQTSAMSGCVTKISNALKGMNKTVSVAYLSGDKCTISSGIQTTDSCLNSYASKNKPIIMMQSANTSSVSIYSFYGTTLKLKGDDSFMNYCVAVAFLK
ncbi:MAG: hypothetical protein KGH74_03470 [Candidatus Micrarchaeota archaeon]|nr:hypothetical protein [Candidatus Micrarchaeota archaeon]